MQLKQVSCTVYRVCSDKGTQGAPNMQEVPKRGRVKETRKERKIATTGNEKNFGIKIIFQMLSFSSIGFQLHFGRLHRSKVELLSTFFIFQDFEISASNTM